MFEIEYLVAVICILFFAVVALVSAYNSLTSSDKLAIMAEELEKKNVELRCLEQQLYKYKFFEELKNNDEQDI